MEIVLTEEFRHALALLAEGKHLFLTGKAGTGKSTLIRRFIAETDRNVVVVATTGIAALNVNGYTIHRLFRFPHHETTLRDVRGGDYQPGQFTKTLASRLDTLIIDEASDGARRRVRHAGRGAGAGRPKPAGRSAACRSCWSASYAAPHGGVTEGEAAFFSTTSTPYFFLRGQFHGARDDFPPWR